MAGLAALGVLIAGLVVGAWLYHVPVCWTTLWLYGWAVVRSALHRAPHSREGWQH